jgi:predicted DNA-binding protein with PD1-like motif
MRSGRYIVERLVHGEDIMGQIEDLSRDEKVDTATFFAIGALMEARLAYYDQSSHEYQEISIGRPVELVSCSGNISIRDGRPFAHAHAVLADSKGETVGGHLLGGKIFAAELILHELLGPLPVRRPDAITGLHLWGEL